MTFKARPALVFSLPILALLNACGSSSDTTPTTQVSAVQQIETPKPEASSPFVPTLSFTPNSSLFSNANPLKSADLTGIQTPNSIMPDALTGQMVLGPVEGANVCVYAVTNGAVAINSSNTITATPIVPCVKTDVTGTYSFATLGGYSGDVLVEAKGPGGFYTDEATGNYLGIGSSPRRTVVGVTGRANAIITPLTHLATQRAGNFSASAFTAAAETVATEFGLNGIDIAKTKPTFASNVRTATNAYALTLGTLSQYSSNVFLAISNWVPTNLAAIQAAASTYSTNLGVSGDLTITPFSTTPNTSPNLAQAQPIVVNTCTNKTTLSKAYSNFAGADFDDNNWSFFVRGASAGPDSTYYKMSSGAQFPSQATGILDSISFKLGAPVRNSYYPNIDGDVKITLYSDTGANSYGTALASWNLTVPQDGFIHEMRVRNVDTSISLQKDKSYWVLLEPSSSKTTIVWFRASIDGGYISYDVNDGQGNVIVAPRPTLIRTGTMTVTVSNPCSPQ